MPPSVPGPTPGAPSPTNKYPRRRCDNCGTFYPQTKPHKRFCKTECKKEFHRHGAAFGPLKQRIEKMISKEVTARVAIEAARLVAQQLSTETLLGRGFVHRSQLRGLFERVRKLEGLARMAHIHN